MQSKILSMKKLTIITICYNIVSTIKRTCESIVNQTFQDFEWIVVDGGSTDGTVDILKTYSSRIDILISEPDKGIYNAMNKGIKLATGEYVNFMNGGDEFYDNKVLENVFEGKEYDADVIYGNSQHISDKIKQIKQTPSQITEYSIYHYYKLTHSACFIKTKIQKKNLFNEKMKISADREFFSKLLKHKYQFYKKNITISTFYEDGISSNNIDQKNKEDIFIKKKYFRIIYIKEKFPKIGKFAEFINNSIQYPRYFGGWIKQKIKKIK